MKTYTNSSNAARAAKKALGSKAKNKVDFLIAGSGKEFTWSRMVPATSTGTPGAAKKKRIKGEAKLQDQPQMQKLIKACQRKDGVTVLELAALLGNVEQHTVRGSISRLKAEGVKITATRTGARKHFHIEASA